MKLVYFKVFYYQTYQSSLHCSLHEILLQAALAIPQVSRNSMLLLINASSPMSDISYRVLLLKINLSYTSRRKEKDPSSSCTHNSQGSLSLVSGHKSVPFRLCSSRWPRIVHLSCSSWWVLKEPDPHKRSQMQRCPCIDVCIHGRA